MHESPALRIRRAVAEYLARRLTINQFLDQFMDAAEAVEESADPSLLDLVDSIKLYWAEYTNGDHTEQEFRHLLQPIVNQPIVNIYTVPIQSGQAAREAAISTSATQNIQIEQIVLRDGNLPREVSGRRAASVHSDATTFSYSEALTIVDEPQRNVTQELVFQE